MRLRYIFILMAILFSTITSAAPAPKVLITVSLSKSLMVIHRKAKNGLVELKAPIVPIAPGTVRPGVFKVLRMTERYKSRNGNVFLENVIRVEGEFNIRTTTMFEHWVNTAPASRAIVLRAEDGSLLFTTVRKYGLNRTQIRIVP